MRPASRRAREWHLTGTCKFHAGDESEGHHYSPYRKRCSFQASRKSIRPVSRRHTPLSERWETFLLTPGLHRSSLKARQTPVHLKIVECLKRRAAEWKKIRALEIYPCTGCQLIASHASLVSLVSSVRQKSTQSGRSLGNEMMLISK